MLLLVLKRMLSNKWMVLCLLIGSIMAVALVSSIPVYTDGILQRMLIRDMENYQVDSGTYPGTYQFISQNLYAYEAKDRINAFRYFNNKITGEMAPAYGIPLVSQRQEISLSYAYIWPNGKINTNSEKKSTQITALSDLDNHIAITHGRMYSKDVKDGVYEVIVTEKGLQASKLVLDKVYPVEFWGDQQGSKVSIKITGVYTFRDKSDPYWDTGIGEYNSHMLMDYKLFWKDFVDNGSGEMTSSRWFYSMDYHKINLENVSRIVETNEAQAKWVSKYGSVLSMKLPVIEILKKYTERSKQLKTTLWVIMIPVLIMLTFYIFMVSQLLVKHDENGIAVLESRGASRLQITFSYLLESLIISAVALGAGPWLGLLICMVLGSSNGFLEFVQRTALPLSLNKPAFLYSLAAVGFLILTMLIPVISSSRTTIVNYKQKKAGDGKKQIWKKFFLDFVALALAGYGYYRYTQQMKVLKTTGVKASEMQIDPLLFVISTLFVLGVGLMFLRVYPLFLRLVYRAGRKFWPPSMYVSLLQVGRSQGQEQFLMLFIILAISIGLFNANSARTINKNVEDKVRYAVGADVTLLAKWEDNQPKSSGFPMGAPGGEGDAAKKEPLRYYEPDYTRYSTLSGTEKATKVFLQNNGVADAGGEAAGNLNVMGIVPNEFAKIAWFREDLLPHHWFEYLNLLSDAPRAFILSSNLKEKLKVQEGDTIYISWGDQDYLEGMVYAFVDYWPTLSVPETDPANRNGGFVVMNLTYLQNKLAIQPYQVWIKKAPGATDKQLNDDLANKKLQISTITYTNQELVKKKNDPMLQGTNGALTLGFVAAMLISLLGFLIYWIISIQSRVLQFGIFRAMGLSLAGVIAIIAFEQLLVSGAAIIAGIAIGGMAGDIFIPFFQMLNNAAEQIPPFKIVAFRQDYIKIYIVLATMLIGGFGILWRIIAGIRMDQALKLGED